MQSGTNQLTSTTKRQSGVQHTNPLARAMSESEHSTYQHNQAAPQLSNPFSEALARAGGTLADHSNSPQLNEADQLKKLEEQRKKEALRKKLHDQINQTNRQQEIFNAREKQVAEEIKKLRQDLKMMAIDVQKFEKEIDITLMAEVADPGHDGKYHITFFQQLRAFIMLLRQKIKSARTWATQLNGKKKKKAKGKKPGLEIGGQQHEKTSTVYDMMHHERSSTYSGS